MDNIIDKSSFDEYKGFHHVHFPDQVPIISVVLNSYLKWLGDNAGNTSYKTVRSGLLVNTILIEDGELAMMFKLKFGL